MVKISLQLLKKKDIKLSSPYKIYKNSRKGYFSFTTEKNVKYACSFLIQESPNQFLGLDLQGQVFNLTVFIVESQMAKKSQDELVGLTISLFLNRVLNRNPNDFIAYICDNQDLKAKARFRCFQNWFKKYNKDQNKALVCGSIEGAIYAGVIMNRTNPDLEKITGFFEKELQDQLTENQDKIGEVKVIV